MSIGCNIPEGVNLKSAVYGCGRGVLIFCVKIAPTVQVFDVCKYKYQNMPMHCLSFSAGGRRVEEDFGYRVLRHVSTAW